MFTALWIAQLVSNLGSWMQSVGAQWMLVSEPNASVLVSLVQTAGLTPVMLLSLPAGVLADLVNRRKLLIWSQASMAVFAAILTFLTWSDKTTPAVLLLLIFLLGCGQALSGPAFQAIQPELVPRSQIPASAALNASNVNIARAIGPALAGVLVSLSGPTLVFGLNAISFAAVLLALVMWHEAPSKSKLPSEPPLQALDAGLQFVRHAKGVRRVLLRSILFIAPASAVWALMPVVAKGRLEQGSAGYGVMLGAVGAGAVVGTLIMSTLRKNLPDNLLLAASAVVFGLGALVMATLSSFPLVLIVLFLAGIAWLVSLGILNAGMQLLLPEWVRARGMAVYLLVFMGGQAVGSMVWGFVANAIDIDRALLVAFAWLVLTAVSVLWWPLGDTKGGIDVTVRDGAYWPEPHVVYSPDPSDGPVMVLNVYRIKEENLTEFIDAMGDLGRSRRRTGAMAWQLYRDVGEHFQFVESFTVRSWTEHLRQHGERITGVDRRMEDRVEALLTEPSQVRHLIAVHDDQPVSPLPTQPPAP